jgi:hypothetical protein
MGVDFADVERKKAALFFDTPELGFKVIQDRPIAPKDEKEAAALAGIGTLNLSTLIAWHQDMVNTMLGPQRANAKHAVIKSIFECLCPSGIGPVSVGYQVTMKTIQRETPVLDPITQQPVMKPVPALEQVGAMLGVMPPAMPEPLTQMVDVEIPIYERWFVSPFSSMSVLVPASFKDTDFRRAPWMGNDWRKPASQVRREYHLPKDWKASADETVKTTFDDPTGKVDEEAAGDPYVTGVEIFYRTELRSEDEVHPEAMRKLVLVDGNDTPLVHCDSPYQDFDPETGEMSRDSLKGFVVRPLVLRDLSDSAWVPSDCSVTRQLTREGEKYRGQVIEQREGNKLVIAFDSDKMDPTAVDKIKKANGVLWVPLVGGALAQGVDSIMAQVAQPTLGRETYMGMDVIDRDRERILGIGANQAGTQTKGRRTATESTYVNRNSEARFEQERQRVLEWFLDVAAAFDTLLIRYADERIAVEILGETRGKLWAIFKGQLAGCYSYNLAVDSGKYLDIEADRQQTLQTYGQIRKDPMINPRPLLRKIAMNLGEDPAEFVVEPQKPEKEMKASISFKATEDFNPANPSFAINVELARQAGWQISEDAVKLAQGQASGASMVSGVAANPNQQGQPEHPGMMEKAPTINQHVVDASGDRSGPKVM